MMEYRPLGQTGLEVSRIAFGAGPIPALMTAGAQDLQRVVLQRAIDCGVNWIDTAATYGDGRSEESLGKTLTSLSAQEQVHVATKVRLLPEDLRDIAGNVRKSLEGSLKRLQLERVTLLQIHNSITVERGDEPTSLMPADVLQTGGVLQAMQQLQEEGMVRHLGMTGLGTPRALRTVIESGELQTIQLPYNLVNASAGHQLGKSFPEANYGNIMASCAEQQMGIFAIRIFAGGALVGNAPAAHTYKTKFFPLDLYHRDLERRSAIEDEFVAEYSVKELAARFTLSHPHVTAAIIGFNAPTQIDELINYLDAGTIADSVQKKLLSLSDNK